MSSSLSGALTRPGWVTASTRSSTHGSGVLVVPRLTSACAGCVPLATVAAGERVRREPTL